MYGLDIRIDALIVAARRAIRVIGDPDAILPVRAWPRRIARRHIRRNAAIRRQVADCVLTARLVVVAEPVEVVGLDALFRAVHRAWAKLATLCFVTCPLHADEAFGAILGCLAGQIPARPLRGVRAVGGG